MRGRARALEVPTPPWEPGGEGGDGGAPEVVVDGGDSVVVEEHGCNAAVAVEEPVLPWDGRGSPKPNGAVEEAPEWPRPQRDWEPHSRCWVAEQEDETAMARCCWKPWTPEEAKERLPRCCFLPWPNLRRCLLVEEKGCDWFLPVLRPLSFPIFHYLLSPSHTDGIELN